MENIITKLKNTGLILLVSLFCVGISALANQVPDRLGQEITAALVRSYY